MTRTISILINIAIGQRWIRRPLVFRPGSWRMLCCSYYSICFSWHHLKWIFHIKVPFRSQSFEQLSSSSPESSFTFAFAVNTTYYFRIRKLYIRKILTTSSISFWMRYTGRFLVKFEATFISPMKNEHPIKGVVH